MAHGEVFGVVASVSWGRAPGMGVLGGQGWAAVRDGIHQAVPPPKPLQLNGAKHIQSHEGKCPLGASFVHRLLSWLLWPFGSTEAPEFLIWLQLWWEHPEACALLLQWGAVNPDPSPHHSTGIDLPLPALGMWHMEFVFAVLWLPAWAGFGAAARLSSILPS